MDAPEPKWDLKKDPNHDDYNYDDDDDGNGKFSDDKEDDTVRERSQDCDLNILASTRGYSSYVDCLL